jgi:DNA-binding XRE family transcriptional regulator
VWVTGSERQARFGEVLRSLRVAAGLTQDELAERAELSSRWIRQLERGGMPRPGSLGRLSAALGLPREARDAFERVAAGGPATATPTATARTTTSTTTGPPGRPPSSPPSPARPASARPRSPSAGRTGRGGGFRTGSST